MNIVHKEHAYVPILSASRHMCVARSGQLPLVWQPLPVLVAHQRQLGCLHLAWSLQPVMRLTTHRHADSLVCDTKIPASKPVCKHSINERILAHQSLC